MHIGLDIGTSGVKALLINETRSIVGSADSPLEVSRPHANWSEQNPTDWIAASKIAITELRSLFPNEMANVSSIGLSGHMHGAVLVDHGGEPLRPCILWNDGRSVEECHILEDRADFRGIGGNVVMAGFTAPKLEWVRRNEPEIFSRIHKVLLPKDFVRLWLTGDYAAEMSDAAGTLWLDVGNRKWSSDLIAATGLNEDQMPKLFEGSETTGQLRETLCSEFGIKSAIVAGGGGDNAATACGMGVLETGAGFVSLGTSGVLFAVTDRYSPNTGQAVHTFCHAVPDTWHQMGVILSAVDSLNWLASIAGRTAPELSARLPNTIVKPSPVKFLPYLSGERTPHNDPLATGMFDGLKISSDIDDLTQAVMEGVAFAIGDCLNALKASGTKLDAVYAVGGGSRSDQWLQMIAAVTDLRILVPQQNEFGAALGAAYLGMVAATGMAPQDVCIAPEIEREIVANPDLAASYQTEHEKYRNLYKEGQ